jgi:hypothetical protein
MQEWESSKETTPHLASRGGVIKDMIAPHRTYKMATENCNQPAVQPGGPVHSMEGKRAAVLTPEGVRRMSVSASSSFPHTIVSHEAAKMYGLEKRRLQVAIGIQGPTGVLVWVAED